MPADEYSAVTSGSLKLKGVNPSSKISKSHKKKKPKPTQTPSSDATAEKNKDTSLALREDNSADTGQPDPNAIAKKNDETEARYEPEESTTPPPHSSGKTEAELRHEERRRKRLDERLKREGTKTHKERVEELNRYLSNLSEHHDM
ncbi:hypothetical protein MMC28_002194 [Mycoblastus sanguinarius]|nr:hypothetical protein [Mycoblastus sanguinarius]